MSLYPELDGQSVDELMRAFDGAPLDGDDTAVAYFQEVADKIAEAGSRGVDFLWAAADRVIDAPRRRALILALSVHAQRSERLCAWLRWMLNAGDDVAPEAIDALRRIGDRDAAAPIVELFDSNAEFVRGAVLRYLCWLDPEAAWPYLARAAIDPSYIVRENAADEMGELGDARAIALLEKLALDDHAHVREAAQSALDTLRQ